MGERGSVNIYLSGSSYFVISTPMEKGFIESNVRSCHIFPVNEVIIDFSPGNLEGTEIRRGPIIQKRACTLRICQEKNERAVLESSAVLTKRSIWETRRFHVEWKEG